MNPRETYINIRRMVTLGLFGGFGLAGSQTFSDTPWYYPMSLIGFTMLMTSVYYMRKFSFDSMDYTQQHLAQREHLVRESLPELEIDPALEGVHYIRCHGLVYFTTASLHKAQVPHSSDPDNLQYEVDICLGAHAYEVWVSLEYPSNPKKLRWTAFIQRIPHPDDPRRQEDKYWTLPWVPEDDFTRNHMGRYTIEPKVEQEIIEYLRTDSFFRLR